MKYPGDMDEECITLCNALNALPGIRTLESCCGHRRDRFMVIFACTSFDGLAVLARNCHSSAWTVEACWTNGSNSLYFCLTGPVGAADMPGGADDLASWLENCTNCDHEWVDARNRFVVSGEICLKCNSVRAGNQKKEIANG